MTPSKSIIVHTTADSGSTHTYLKMEDVNNKNIAPTSNLIHAILPTNKQRSSSHTTTMNILCLSTRAKNTHILSELKLSSLLSIGQLCDDNYVAIFTKNKLRVTKEQKLILEGTRES